MNRFSIITACYDFEAFIGPCIESIVSQEYPADGYEVICVNDGSRDRSLEIMNEYADRHPQVRVIDQDNRGLERSLNRALDESRFPYVMRVDADDMLGAGYLSRMDRAITSEPGGDIFYARSYYEYYGPDEMTERMLPDFDTEEIFRRGDFFATGTVYRRSDVQAAGGFPERVKNCGLENYTVMLRLVTMGKRGVPVDGVRFYYRRHRTNLSIVKKDAIIRYGRVMMNEFGREYRTNEYHPYGLVLDGI